MHLLYQSCNLLDVGYTWSIYDEFIDYPKGSNDLIATLLDYLSMPLVYQLVLIGLLETENSSEGETRHYQAASNCSKNQDFDFYPGYIKPSTLGLQYLLPKW